MAQRKRPHRVQVRFTDEEMAMLRQRAVATRRPLARLVREAALDVVPKQSPARATDAAIHRLALLYQEIKKLSTRDAVLDREALLSTNDEIVVAIKALARAVALRHTPA